MQFAIDIFCVSLNRMRGSPNEVNFIADAIGVNKSTVYRELKRNSGKRGYSHALAQEMADERKERIVNNSRKKPEVWRHTVSELRQVSKWRSTRLRRFLPCLLRLLRNIRHSVRHYCRYLQQRVGGVGGGDEGD